MAWNRTAFRAHHHRHRPLLVNHLHNIKTLAMLRLSLFSLFLVPSLTSQVTFKSGSNPYWKTEKDQDVLCDEDRTKWNLNKPPNPDGTDHLIFETVYSLLQLWSNTRMRNGERRVHLLQVVEHTFLLQATTLYRESFQKVLFSTVVQKTTRCRRFRIGFLQILNMRMPFAGVCPHLPAERVLTSKVAGTSPSRPLVPSRYSTLTAAVQQRSHAVQWTHRISLHGVMPIVYPPTDSELKNFVHGERNLVWMLL